VTTNGRVGGDVRLGAVTLTLEVPVLVISAEGMDAVSCVPETNVVL